MRVLFLIIIFLTARFVTETQSAETATLDPIIVSGEKINFSTTNPSVVQAQESLAHIAGGADLIRADEYNGGRALTPQDLLGYSPGIFVQQRDTGAQESRVSIRGSGLQRTFHLRGILLLQDGVPLNEADGGGDFYKVEPLATSYSEVFRGGNALRFGATTLGGAINMVSYTGYDASLLQARAEGGSFGYLRSQLSSGQVLGPMDYYVSLSQFKQEGFRDHTQQDNHYEYFNAGHKINSEVETRIYVTNAVTKAKLGGSLTKTQLFTNPTMANASSVSGNQKRDINYWRVASKTSYVADEHQVDISAYVFEGDLFHPIFQVLDVNSQDYGGEIKYTNTAPLGNRENHLIFGFAPSLGYKQDNRFTNVGGSRGTRTAQNDQEAYNLNFYAEDHLSLTDKLDIIPGLQLSYASRQSTDYYFPNGDDSGQSIYRALNPKAGVTYDLSDSTKFFAGYTRGFEPPTFSELFNSTSDFLPNKAQRSHTAEAGVRGKEGIIGLDATYYHSWIKKELLSLSDGAGTPLGTINARGTTIHQGIELGADLNLWQGLMVNSTATQKDGLKLRGVYNWGDFRFVDDAVYGNNQLPGLPAHFLKMELNYHHPKGFYLGPNVERSVSEYPIDMANSFHADPYTIWGLKAGYKVEEGFSLFVEGKNLSDKVYASSTGIINNAAGLDSNSVFNPGNGRAWYGGVEWLW